VTRPDRDREPSGVTVTFPVHLRNGNRGRRRMRKGERAPSPQVQQGRVPRVARLMALAIHFDGLIRQGLVNDYADLARLGGVSRTRISQVMELLNLDPGIQEQLLLLPRTADSRDRLAERNLSGITNEVDWSKQRALAAPILEQRASDDKLGHLDESGLPISVPSERDCRSCWR
jgi:hypothetical protein